MVQAIAFSNGTTRSEMDVAQLQCSNCGGYKITTASQYVCDNISIPHKLWFFGLGPAILVASVVLLAISATVTDGLKPAGYDLPTGTPGSLSYQQTKAWEKFRDKSSDVEAIAFLAVAGIGVVCCVVGYVIVPTYYSSKRKASQRVSRWECYCQLCRNRWFQRAGQAIPRAFTPNPAQRELMNKGQRRLEGEEEEERRRKADLDETAAYLAQRYYQQHKK